MQKNDGNIIYSATDIVNFLECPHIINLDITNLDTPLPKAADDPQSIMIQDKGLEHETSYLEYLKDNSFNVAEINSSSGDDEERARQTLEAMRKGVPYIYQAVLLSGTFIGKADFLMHVESPSKIGNFSYEVIDTKLSRSEKTKFIIQLCFYSELLALVQAFPPHEMHLVLGDKTVKSFRTADYFHYYKNVKSRFLKYLETSLKSSYPEKCDYCDICRWRALCTAQWIKDDHLNQVANIRSYQIKKIKENGITTLAQLAALKENDKEKTFAKLSKQASLQLSKRKTSKNEHDLLELDPLGVRGFYRMPKPNAGDIFFDMEGDPLEPDGHEYLFGVYYFENGAPQYKDFWALHKDDERDAFEKFIDFVMDRLHAYPGMHIYHYAPYEETAIKRLMSYYGTRENEVDDLLRYNILVDLYKIVREGVIVSEPRYSIKNLEHFYMDKREGDVKSGGESIVYFDVWRKTGDKEKLKEIRDYNEIDCRSTYLLREWLLWLRPKEISWFIQAFQKEESTQRNIELETKLKKYEQKLLGGISTELNTLDNAKEIKVRRLVLHLLDFYRREKKPAWWKFYDLRDNKTKEELIEELEAIGGLELDRVHSDPKHPKSSIYIYSFPPQEFKLRPGQAYRLDMLKSNETIDILDIDESKHQVIIRHGKKKTELPDRLSVGQGPPIETKVLEEALYRFADTVINNSSKYSAIKDFLYKRIPRIYGHTEGTPIAGGFNPSINSIIKAVAGLQKSYIFIQGPPGSGKTYTGSHIIADLLQIGKKVGISSNSHKAINNLLDGVVSAAKKQGVRFRGVKKISNPDQEIESEFIRNEKDNNMVLSDDPQLIAGTAWLFARPDFDELLDYLFVDEAGQVSLAHLVAMGTSARNIILLGDQMQLGQPIAGVHPGDSGKSALEYLLEERAAIPPEEGIFLGTTWRMHDDICRFISDVVYDGKLHPESQNKNQRLILKKDAHEAIKPTGISFLKVQHSRCKQKSREEADVVLEIYRNLLQQSYLDKNGNKHPMKPEDILIVSPYNVQVNLLKETLPGGARVGTIDKFQGQEANVVIISMATSSGEDLPRNIEFLYSKNRLNVAISRAKCLAVLVANPNLLSIKCNTVEQMELVNTLCWLDEYAKIPELILDHKL